MKWGLEDVAGFTGGTASGRAVVESVSIDSRTTGPGDLFVAVRGDHDDGHAYLDAALEAGAAAVLVERGRLGPRTGVEVDDTMEALLALATARRSDLECPVIAVTGSSGKTTTKDFIGHILGGRSHRSPRSFNNEYGVPLTVLGAPDDCDALVIEVGSRGSGHIAALAPAIRPTVALITTIGRAHLEMFGDVAGVAEAKWELVAALEPGGTAVLPHAETALRERATVPVVTFGVDEGDVAATDVVLDEIGRARFDLIHGSDRIGVEMPIPGRHQPLNAAGAVAAAVAAGRRFDEVAPRLAEVEVSPWRMQLDTVEIDGGSALVLNDAYNANPDSMVAALETAAAMPGRHLAVLGKMFELGEHEVDAHREIGARAVELGFTVIAVGDDPGIAAGAGAGAIQVADAEEALGVVRSMMTDGDVILIKASRAAGLEEIAAGIGGGTA